MNKCPVIAKSPETVLSKTVEVTIPVTIIPFGNEGALIPSSALKVFP